VARAKRSEKEKKSRKRKEKALCLVSFSLSLSAIVELQGIEPWSGYGVQYAFYMLIFS
jgi:hypothetical protein